VARFRTDVTPEPNEEGWQRSRIVVMDYLMGDVQGCCDALDRLLADIGFSPSRDRLCVLGDLVNRGPASLATLQRLRGLGDAATCLLGNHDLHLLAVSHGVRKPHRNDTLDPILTASDRDAWLDWMRHQPLAASFSGWLCVHAGVVPAWTADQTLRVAEEVQAELRGARWPEFMTVMYGNRPDAWRADLSGHDRLRLIVNVLTRVRFVDGKGRLDLDSKGSADKAPPGFMPWFEAPGRKTCGTPIAFGHWSTLGLVNRPDLLALDTGCVWGGRLSVARVDGGRRDVWQVACEPSRKPGGGAD
jgi:bis(5'-nucleosyl)-tetraphosphatase (symmetrical)